MRRWPALLVVLWLVTACSAREVTRTAPTPRLAYVGLDDHIYTIAIEGGDPRRVSSAPGEAPVPAGQRLARWPTWSTDGSRLAFLRYELSRVQDDRATVFVVEPGGANLTKAFESDRDAPIYLSWAPDNTALTLLTQREESLRLYLIDPAGATSASEVATGAPLYFAWAPDARQILVHVNGDSRASDQARLTLARRGSSDPPAELSSKPSDFRAPSWSPDGNRVALVAQMAGGQAALSVEDLRGGETNRMAVLGAEPVVLWSPAGDRLAFSSRISSELPVYNGVETIKADGGDRQQATDARVVAFYWSPDGKRLAYAALDAETRALVWFVADPDGKNRRQIGSFVPSEDEFAMFRFFDQFAQSHAVWSPDGRYLVYAGRAPDAAGRSPKPGTQSQVASGPTQVFVAPADGSTAPKVLVDGRLAIWPPAPPREK